MNKMMNLLRPPPPFVEVRLYCIYDFFNFLLRNWPFKKITATCSKIDIKYRLWINRFKMGQNSPKMIGSECSEICLLLCMILELITKVSSNSACFWDELRSPIKKNRFDWMTIELMNYGRVENILPHYPQVKINQNKTFNGMHYKI